MLTIKIKTNSEAFHNDCNGRDSAQECARLLRIIAGELEDGETDKRVFDADGVAVGTYKLTNR